MALYQTAMRSPLDGRSASNPFAHLMGEGGTTSLPQYLQQRQPGSTQPAQSATSPTTGTQTAGVQNTRPNVNPTSTQRPAVIAQAPNAQGATQAATPVPPPQAGAVGLENLRGVIERQLGTPSRYDSELAQKIRTQGMQQLTDQANTLRDRARADAASRSVFHGSPLTSSLGDIDERYLRGVTDLETNIQREAATTHSNDLGAAISNAMGFGREQRADSALRANVLQVLAQLGMQGGPTIPGSVDAFGQLPLPNAGGDNSALYALLGQLFS